MSTDDKGRPEEGRNEGEGNRSAAREYNQAQHEFVESGEAERHRNDAQEMTEEERLESERAEKIGQSHAKEEDPALKRDYGHPEK